MDDNILKHLLLFEFRDWQHYGGIILSVCQAALYPVFVFSLVYDQLSRQSEPEQLLKRLLVAQLIISFAPVYYKDVVSFGFKLGDSIIREEKQGIISSWMEIRKASLKASEKEKRDPTVFEEVSGMFSLNPAEVVIGLGRLLIFVCLYFLKFIFSFVYYTTYCLAGIFAVLSVAPPFKNHALGILRTVVFLILSVVVISLVLVFVNRTFVFEVGKRGFLEGIESLAQFIVLAFVLLGSLKIAQSLVGGRGGEDWAAQTSNALGFVAGLTIAKLGTKKILEDGTDLTKAGVGLTMSGGLGAARLFSTPIRAGASAIKQGIGKRSNEIRDKKLNTGLEGHTRKDPSYKNNFLNSVNDSDNGLIKSSLSPRNHFSALGNSAIGVGQNVVSRLAGDHLSRPEQFFSNTSISEKALLMTDSLVNRGSAEERIKQRKLVSYPGFDRGDVTDEKQKAPSGKYQMQKNSDSIFAKSPTEAAKPSGVLSQNMTFSNPKTSSSQKEGSIFHSGHPRPMSNGVRSENLGQKKDPRSLCSFSSAEEMKSSSRKKRPGRKGENNEKA